MKLSVITALIALIALALPAFAQAPHQVCIRTHEIQKSEPARDEKSILFVMRNGDQWRAALRSRCTGISFDGFSWVLSGNDEVCENGQTLKVNNPGGSVCVLGAFTKLPGR